MPEAGAIPLSTAPPAGHLTEAQPGPPARSRGLAGTQACPSSAGPAAPPPPPGALVSPHSSQGSGAAGTTEVGHGRGSPRGPRSSTYGAPGTRRSAGPDHGPSLRPGSLLSQHRPQAWSRIPCPQGPKRGWRHNGEWGVSPPQHPAFFQPPRSRKSPGLREGGVTSAESAVKARPEAPQCPVMDAKWH